MPARNGGHNIYSTKIQVFREDRARLAELALPGEAVGDTVGRLIDFYNRHRHMDPVNRLRTGGSK